MCKASLKDLVYVLTKDMTEEDLNDLVRELSEMKTERKNHMGNRAVITASMAEDVASSNDIGVYLHWNGRRDSVEAFLTYCKMQGFRSPDSDNYGWARLCQVISNFFGGDGLSIGIDRCCNLDCDNGDNGVYVIKGWDIVGRKYFEWDEQCNYDLYEMLVDIDEDQPNKMQLGKEKIAAELQKVGMCCNRDAEIKKLDQILTEMNVDHTYEESDGDRRIFVYKDGKCYWDAICTASSYGGHDGLLEVYGKIVPDGDAKGHLTADQVIEMMKKMEG